MKKLLSLVAIGLALSLGMAHAAETKQQTKMGDCNKAAADKKGDERKAFMKTCLSADAPAAAAKPEMTQGQKMGACSKEAAAKGLKGDERNKYLSTCSKA